MRTCDISQSYCYDPTQELAESCGRPAIGVCADCEADVCLAHSQLCACGSIFCDACLHLHQVSCEEFKLEEYRKVKRYLPANSATGNRSCHV